MLIRLYSVCGPYNNIFFQFWILVFEFCLCSTNINVFRFLEILGDAFASAQKQFVCRNADTNTDTHGYTDTYEDTDTIREQEADTTNTNNFERNENKQARIGQ